jgi:hypothetical protein
MCVIRLFILIEAASFIAAALTHFGMLAQGYQHRMAGRAESIIGIVLLAGWALTWIRPAWARGVGLSVQGFALLGTLVGLYTIAIGIGPRTTPDLIYHGCIVIVLVSGLVLTLRARTERLK